MMQQYFALKAEAGDCLLFYRMGDFFELFFDDAKVAAAALDIALTARGEHGGAKIPMCGVPVHAMEGYLARLIKAGHRVAIAEQTETPEQAKRRGGAKALVSRGIIRFAAAWPTRMPVASVAKTAVRSAAAPTLRNSAVIVGNLSLCPPPAGGSIGHRVGRDGEACPRIDRQ